MKVFGIRFDPDDKALIDITTASPEPVEAFTFTPSGGGTRYQIVLGKNQKALMLEQWFASGKL